MMHGIHLPCAWTAFRGQLMNAPIACLGLAWAPPFHRLMKATIPPPPTQVTIPALIVTTDLILASTFTNSAFPKGANCGVGIPG